LAVIASDFRSFSLIPSVAADERMTPFAEKAAMSQALLHAQSTMRGIARPVARLNIKT
jgi:hypothetical protein